MKFEISSGKIGLTKLIGVRKNMISYKGGGVVSQFPIFSDKEERGGKKKSRARISIKGHCVLLQNSPRIKMFDFFLNSQNYCMSQIFLGILLNPQKKW